MEPCTEIEQQVADLRALYFTSRSELRALIPQVKSVYRQLQRLLRSCACMPQCQVNLPEIDFPDIDDGVADISVHAGDVDVLDNMASCLRGFESQKAVDDFTRAADALPACGRSWEDLMATAGTCPKSDAQKAKDALQNLKRTAQNAYLEVERWKDMLRRLASQVTATSAWIVTSGHRCENVTDASQLPKDQLKHELSKDQLKHELTKDQFTRSDLIFSVMLIKPQELEGLLQETLTPDRFREFLLDNSMIRFRKLTSTLPESCAGRQMGTVSEIYNAVLPVVRHMLSNPWMVQGFRTMMVQSKPGTKLLKMKARDVRKLIVCTAASYAGLPCRQIMARALQNHVAGAREWSHLTVPEYAALAHALGDTTVYDELCSYAPDVRMEVLSGLLTAPDDGDAFSEAEHDEHNALVLRASELFPPRLIVTWLAEEVYDIR